MTSLPNGSPSPARSVGEGVRRVRARRTRKEIRFNQNFPGKIENDVPVSVPHTIPVRNHPITHPHCMGRSETVLASDSLAPNYRTRMLRYRALRRWDHPVILS